MTLIYYTRSEIHTHILVDQASGNTCIDNIGDLDKRRRQYELLILDQFILYLGIRRNVVILKITKICFGVSNTGISHCG